MSATVSLFNFFFLITLILPPMDFKVSINPILVLLNKIFLTSNLDPGNKHAPVIKNAADDGSPGTWYLIGFSNLSFFNSIYLKFLSCFTLIL